MDLNYILIGKHIREYREKKGISQEEIADTLGISWRHFNYIEHGERKTSIDMIVSIANALDVTTDDLLAEHLTGSNATLKSEVYNLMHDCTPTEKVILMDMLKHMKALLLENGI